MNESSWKTCIEFHGHACGGLASGYRVAETAMETLGIPMARAKDEEIVCVSENDACGVDAIQCLLACTVGKGNLIMRPTGKMAFSFFDRNSGKSVRIVIKNHDRSKMTKEESIDRFLNGKTEDLFEIGKPGFELPEKAKIFNSIKCERCGEYAREDRIRIHDGQDVCLDCFREYDRGWF